MSYREQGGPARIKWEYTWLGYPNEAYIDFIEASDKLGADGWEMINMCYTTYSIKAVFKRMLP